MGSNPYAAETAKNADGCEVGDVSVPPASNPVSKGVTRIILILICVFRRANFNGRVVLEQQPTRVYYTPGTLGFSPPLQLLRARLQQVAYRLLAAPSRGHAAPGLGASGEAASLAALDPGHRHQHRHRKVGFVQKEGVSLVLRTRQQ